MMNVSFTASDKAVDGVARADVDRSDVGKMLTVETDACNLVETAQGLIRVTVGSTHYFTDCLTVIIG